MGFSDSRPEDMRDRWNGGSRCARPDPIWEVHLAASTARMRLPDRHHRRYVPLICRTCRTPALLMCSCIALVASAPRRGFPFPVRPKSSPSFVCPLFSGVHQIGSAAGARHAPEREATMMSSPLSPAQVGRECSRRDSAPPSRLTSTTCRRPAPPLPHRRDPRPLRPLSIGHPL